VRGWWSSRIRRTWSYVRASVGDVEREELSGWLTAAELRLFDSMHRADMRHGLDVVAYLRGHGATDPDLLVAGLLHDCGKGRRVRLVHRVAWTLGQRYGTWIWRASVHLPTFRTGLATLRDHAMRSAELAEAAGCSPATIELIRNQETPTNDNGRLLLEADEAN
jgi:hypothetical protein